MIIALVGLPGSGKGAVVKILEKKGFSKIRFGDITDIEIKKRGLEITEHNEKSLREELRKTYGMSAYAQLLLPLIDEKIASKTKGKGQKIVLDGLRSYEELILLKKQFGKDLKVVVIYAPQTLRIKRLSKRATRPLTEQEVKARDYNELTVLNVRKTMKHSEYRIKNIGDLRCLNRKVGKMLVKINQQITR